jgi:hypothetical protein
MTPSARAARILHASLVLGVILVGVVFFFVLRTIPPSFPRASILSFVTAGLGLGNLAAALALFRSKIPRRSADQTPDDYWTSAEARGIAIVTWAIIEGGGLVAWVGYLLTGTPVPAGVGVLAIAALILVRPSRLEGDAGR